MVVIHIKKSDNEQFLYETTTKESNDTVITEIVNIWNMRIRLACLADGLIQLGKYGPVKPLEKQGIDEIQEKAGEIIEKGPDYTPDPTGIRNGNGVSKQLMTTYEKVAEDARMAISKLNVDKKQPMHINFLQEKADNIRGAVMMGFPMGLPTHDPVNQLISDEWMNGLDGSQVSLDILDPSTAQLWWAGKEFFRDQLVGDRLGKNEKTKVVAKLQKPGAGAPQREPAVSEEERKTMMAHYFKKQEELKKLSEADEDDYLYSSWADTSALKNSLRGTTMIRPFR